MSRLRILLILLSFSLPALVHAQSRYYVRADSVYIEKGGGNGELIIKNATRDSTGGIMVNMGGGRTAFLKTRQLTDSTFVIGRDTLIIRGTGQAITNAVTTGDTLLTAANKLKRLDHDATLTFSTNASKILMGVDTFTRVSTPSKLRDTAAALRAAIAAGGVTQFSALTDVTVTTPKNGHRPVYDSISSKWVNRLPPMYNAKDYGAVGDSTTDDRAAILKAIEAMGPRGGILFFPAGRYRVSDSVLVPSYVTIKGVGHAFPTKSGAGYTVTGDTLGATTFIYNVVDKPLFVVKHVSPLTRSFNVGFEGFGIANLGTLPTDGSVGIKLNNAIATKIDNILISGFYRNIQILGGFQYSITRSTFFSPVLYGLDIGNYIEPDAGDFVIDDCLFSTNGATAAQPRAAIYWHGGGGMKMSNVKLNGTYPQGLANRFRYGLYMDFVDGSTSDLNISNSSLENFDSSAIKGVGATNIFRHITITGVQIDGGGNDAPAIDIDDMDDVDITGVVITDNATGNTNPAIRVTNSHNVHIEAAIDDFDTKVVTTGSIVVRVDYKISDQIKIADAANTNMIYVERSNSDGGATLAPTIHMKNTNFADPGGAGYNQAGATYSAGDGAILGQVFSNYGTGASEPYNIGSGFYVGTRTNHPTIFMNNTAESGRITGGSLLFGRTSLLGTEKLSINGSAQFSGNIAIGANSAPTSGIYLERNDNVSSGINQASIRIKNINTTSPTGSGFNIADYTVGAGNDAILAQFGVSYGIGQAAPWNQQSFAIATRTNDPITFWTNDVLRMKLFANGNLTIASLASGGTAPTTSGTTKMVIADATGLFSFADIPSGGGTVSDEAFGPSWDGVTGVSPSKNAIYDALAAIVSDEFELTNSAGTGSPLLYETGVNEAEIRTILIRVNGTPVDTSASTSSTSIHDITISGAVTGTGTSGRVAYWNGSSSLTSDANFLYGTATGLSLGTTNTQGRLNLGGNKSLTSSGVQSYFAAATYNDAITSASGTASSYIINYIAPPTITATNTSVTFPSIATLSVDAPIAGTNATITNKWAIQTGSGGNVNVSGVLQVNSIESDGTQPTTSGAMAVVMVDADGKLSYLKPQTVTSSATVTPTSGNNIVTITAQAVGLTIANPTGTLLDGQAFLIAYKDNGSSQTIAWGSNYSATDFALPIATVAGKWTTLQAVNNTTAGKIFIVGKSQQP